MVISKYLAQRFFLYTTVISVLLATLVTFIGFFEKIVRCKQALLGDVFIFLALDFLPELIEFLPVSVWLATCLVLKDLWVQSEWELMHFLGFVPHRLFAFALTMGLVISLATFGAKESFISSLSVSSEKFKIKHIKKQALSDQRLTHVWADCGQEMFCYMEMFDGKTRQGSDLSFLVFQQPGHMLVSIISAPQFMLDVEKKEVYAPIARSIDVLSRQEKIIHNMRMTLPILFLQLGTNIESTSAIKLVGKLVLGKNLLPSSIYYDLFTKFLSVLSFYMQLLFYPLIIFALVLFFCRRNEKRRWLACASAYPLFSLIQIVIANAASWWLGIAGILLYPIISLGLAWLVIRDK